MVAVGLSTAGCHPETMLRGSNLMRSRNINAPVDGVRLKPAEHQSEPRRRAEPRDAHGYTRSLLSPYWGLATSVGQPRDVNVGLRFNF